MVRPKKKIKIKEPVRLREKQLKDGNKSLYLDIYHKGVRKYEYLKLYIVPVQTPADRINNERVRQIAEDIKAERILSLQSSKRLRIYTLSRSPKVCTFAPLF